MLLLILVDSGLGGCASNQPIASPLTPSSGSIVYVRGREVHSPGKYLWHRGLTVTDVIKAAGGLSDYADEANIQVIHSDETQDRYKYDMILKGEIKDPVLRPGDQVTVIPLFL